MYFYPRSPCGERRQIKQTCRAGISISIHALLAESDNFRSSIKCTICNFYPRSPCGERLISPHSAPDNGNFYPRSPCGERPVPQQENGQAATISIHALLAESDLFYNNQCQENEEISIHALLAESDRNAASHSPDGCLFLSTLSLRRATKCSLGNPCKKPYFYPRSPCGERPQLNKKNPCKILISIHALLAESDSPVQE